MGKSRLSFMATVPSGPCGLVPLRGLSVFSPGLTDRCPGMKPATFGRGESRSCSHWARPECSPARRYEIRPCAGSAGPYWPAREACRGAFAGVHRVPESVVGNNGSPALASECPFLGVKRTSISGDWMSAYSQKQTVRPEGAEHQWRKMPPRELSVDLVANERGGRVTGRLEAS